MLSGFNPADWYWQADDGRIFSSARAEEVSATDTAFKAWCGDARSPTVWPRDESGAQTDASLNEVLTVYGLAVPGVVAVPASVTSAQAKIQLLRSPGSAAGKTLLDDATAAIQGAGGEVAIWFSDARTWERTNTHIGQIASALKLTSDQVDSLFISASKIAA